MSHPVRMSGRVVFFEWRVGTMRFFLQQNTNWIFLFPLFLFAILFSAESAVATTEFQKEFIKLYAKGKEVDKDFKKIIRKGKCYVCHQGKDDHKNCNVYGMALAEYITEDDKKDKKKIIASLKLVADQASDPDSADAPTFGELISKGELPGGSIADSKIEPPKAEGEEVKEDSSEEKPEEASNNESEGDVTDS